MLAKNADENSYFVGHSIGCQTIMRFLEKHNQKIGGVLFVAPWFTLKGLEDENSKQIAKPWITTKIDLRKVKSQCNKFVAIFSDDDPFVPLENEILFKKNLGAKTIMLKKKDHIVGKELKEGFEEILKMPNIV